MATLKEIRKPTCFDCVHSKFISGSPRTMDYPGDPDTSECENKEISNQWKEKYDQLFDELDYDENKLPSKCGHFQPKIITRCGLESCRKEMNVPEYNWPFYTYELYCGELIYVCSEDCKTAIDVINKLELSNK